MYEINTPSIIEDLRSYLRRLNRIKNCLKEDERIKSFNYKEFEEILSEIESLCDISMHITINKR